MSSQKASIADNEYPMKSCIIVTWPSGLLKDVCERFIAGMHRFDGGFDFLGFIRIYGCGKFSDSFVKLVPCHRERFLFSLEAGGENSLV